MAVSVKSAEFQLHEALVQLQEMVSLLDFDSRLYDTLEEAKALIRTRGYRVAVMGEFKRGKSTLLNALLGAPVLPADATPTTAAVSRITYGQKERAVLFFRDGSSEEIPFDGLSEAVTKLTENGQAVSASLREAVLCYPSVICQNYIDLIDTPGLNDEARMTQITIDLLPRVDAVIVPIHARFPFSMTEKQFVCQLLQSDNIHDILFVVTFLDQLDEDDYVYEDYMKALSGRIRREVFAALVEDEAPDAVVDKAHAILDDLQICGLSASMALKAFVTGKKSLLQESRFPEFQKLLLRSLTSGQAVNAIRSTVTSMNSVIDALDEQNTLAILRRQKQEEELKALTGKLEQQFQELLPFLDGLLQKAKPELDDAAALLHPLKNRLMQHFSAALSGAAGYTHMAVFRAIRPAIDTMPDIAAACLQEEVLPEAKKPFLRCLDALERQLREFLPEPELFSSAFREPLLSCMEEEFKNVCFRFTMDPWPRVNDLATADVTGHMADCIDQSVTELYWLLKYTFSEISRQWYPLVFRSGKSVLEARKSSIASQAEILDIEEKAYRNNYPILKQTAENIRRANRKLLEEFAEENASSS